MINEAIMPVIPNNVDSESLNEVIVDSLSSSSAYNFVLYFFRMTIPLFIIHLLLLDILLSGTHALLELDMAEKECVDGKCNAMVINCNTKHNVVLILYKDQIDSRSIKVNQLCDETSKVDILAEVRSERYAFCGVVTSSASFINHQLSISTYNLQHLSHMSTHGDASLSVFVLPTNLIHPNLERQLSSTANNCQPIIASAQFPDCQHEKYTSQQYKNIILLVAYHNILFYNDHLS